MKVGDLVKIKDGVHEDGIPVHRHAVIVEGIDAHRDYVIMFFGSQKRFRFNEYFIIPLQKVD